MSGAALPLGWPHRIPFKPVFLPADHPTGVDAETAHILVVEDDFFVGMELERRLLEAGFKVVGVAATAEEALEKAIADKPDLAILDIRLAGARDGIDLAIELRKKLNIPSIFASAHSDPETLRRAEKAQPKGWLHKPYSEVALIEAVKAALRTQ